MRSATTRVRAYLARSTLALPLLAALMVVGGIALLTWSQFRVTGRARFWVVRTYQVLETVQELRVTVRDAEKAEQRYLLTGEPADLRPNVELGARVRLLSRRLGAFMRGQPDGEARLRAVTVLLDQKMSQLAELVRPNHEDLTARLDAELTSIAEHERHLLDMRFVAADRAEAVTSWLSLVGDVIATALLALAFSLLAIARHRQYRSEAASRDLAAQLRTSLDSIGQGVAVFDAEDGLARWNEPLPLLLGLPRQQLVVGMSYQSLAERIAALWSRDTAGPDAPDPLLRDEAADAPIVRERIRGVDGTGFEVRRAPVRGGGFVLTLTDVTERVRVERAARETQRMQAIGRLTGGIAHDFNNLLAVVMGNLELAISRLREGDYMRERLERAMWGVRRGARLTHQLLAFAREQPLAPQPHDVAAILADITGLLGRTMGERIDVRFARADGTWPALIDATQLESAVLNLALNARDAMPDGGSLTIEVRNCPLDQSYADRHAEVAPGDYVMIAVSDTGTGMTKQVVARAFEPFFTTKDVGRGTGLGLAMVFGFAKQSGGHVDLESAVGRGTIVRLFLPRAAEPPPSATTARGAIAPPGPATLALL